MAGGRPPLAACKECGTPVEHRSILSKRGLCPACSDAIRTAEILQLRARSGPYFKHWRQQMAASVGGVLLDDVTAGD